MNYNSYPPSIPFPVIVNNSPQLHKTFKIKNTGIADVKLDWKIFDSRDIKEEKGDIFDI
jgi:hypothetical protein